MQMLIVQHVESGYFESRHPENNSIETPAAAALPQFMMGAVFQYGRVLIRYTFSQVGIVD